MSAKEQIGMEVRNIAQPIVQSVAKQNVMLLAKDIVPLMVKESVDDLELPNKVPQNTLLVSPITTNPSRLMLFKTFKFNAYLGITQTSKI